MFIKSKNPIDVHLAMRLKTIRILSGVTQKELGELIGVTFQQIQKYETCINRLSASRLYEICRVLNRPILSFFSNFSLNKIDRDCFHFDFICEKDLAAKTEKKDKELKDVISAFVKIEDDEIRLNIVNLLQSMTRIKMDRTKCRFNRI